MILVKISTPKTYLNRDDLSPNQKKYLWELMAKYGSSQGFAYDRFFKEGFNEWELVGIEKIKKDFLKLHEKEIWTQKDDDGDAGYNGVITFLDGDNHFFYDLIGRARLKMAFVAYMAEKGMGANTVLKRFGELHESDFHEYERIGIIKIVEIFEQNIKSLNIA